MNSKKVGAAAVICDAEGWVLLVRHRYGALNWELPGGGAHINESPAVAAQREVREETGIEVLPQRMTGVYYDCQTDWLHFVFLCRQLDPNFQPHIAADNSEISAIEFFAPGNWPRPISDFTVRRIEDALAGRDISLPAEIGPRVWL